MRGGITIGKKPFGHLVAALPMIMCGRIGGIALNIDNFEVCIAELFVPAKCFS